jgi:small subunit ribosomal protein S17
MSGDESLESGGAETAEAASKERKIPKTVVGVVTSDKMQKTRTVTVTRLEAHPLYGKYLRRRTKFKAHDEGEISHIGDTVRIAACRPVAKTKSWRLLEVVEKAKVAGPKAAAAKAAAPESEAPGEEGNA